MIHMSSYFGSYERNWPIKISFIVMFDEASNVQLGEKLLNVNFPKLTVMSGIEHKVLLFFNDVS